MELSLNSFVRGCRSQRKTSEAALANEPQFNAPAAGEIFQPSARVINGMVLVLRLKSDHKKFSDIGECLSTSDLIFSLVCIERIQFSKLNAEREHRGTEYGNKFRNERSGYTFTAKTFTQHKKKLIQGFLFLSLMQPDRATAHWLWYHARRYRCLQTCVSFKHSIPSSIFKCGTKTKVRYISITSIVVATQWALMLDRVRFWTSNLQRTKILPGNVWTLGSGIGPGGVLPNKRLMGRCRWMGSHFHDWMDYNGVVFSRELLEGGCTFSDFLG